MTENNEFNKEQYDSVTKKFELPVRGIMCIDEDGVILDICNDTINILGHETPAAIQDKTIFDYIVTDDLENAKHKLAEARRDNVTSSAYISIKWPKEGVLKTEVGITPWMNDSTKGQFILIINVIGLHTKEGEMYVREGDGSDSPVVKTDVEPEYQPDGPQVRQVSMFAINGQGMVQSWNESCSTFFGYAENEVVKSKTVFELIDSGMDGKISNVIKTALISENDFHADLKFKTGSGSGTPKECNLTITKCMEFRGRSEGYICMFYPLESPDEPVKEQTKTETGQPAWAVEHDSLAENIPMAKQAGIPAASEAEMAKFEAVTAQNSVNLAHCLGYNDLALVTSAGDIKFMTDNFANQLGYESFDELREHKWFEFLKGQSDNDIYKKVSSSGEFNTEFWSNFKNGTNGTNGTDGGNGGNGDSGGNGGLQNITPEAGSPEFMRSVRLPYRTKEGSVMEIDLQIIPIADSTGRYTEAIWLLNPENDLNRPPEPPAPPEPAKPPAPLDLDNSTEPELALMELHNDLIALSTISTTIEQTTDIDEITRSVLGTVLGTISVEYGGLYLIENDRLKLKYSIGLPENIDQKPITYPKGADVQTLTAITNENFRKFLEPGTNTSWTVPILSDGEVLGFINLASKSENELTGMDVDLINSAAYQLAGAIARQNLLNSYKELENKYKSFFDNSPDIFFTVTKNGEIRSCNRTVFDRLGYSRKELVGKNFLEFFKEKINDNSNRFSNWFKKVMILQEPSDIDLELTSKEGELRYYNASIMKGSSRFSGWETEFRVVLRDVTDYRSPAEGQKETNELLFNIFNSSKDAVIYLDESKKIVECNTSVTDMFGYARDEIVEKSVDLLYANKLLMERYFDKLSSVYTEDSELNQEQVIRRKDGTMFVASVKSHVVKNEDGSNSGMALTFTDITERKREEKEFLEAKKESVFYVNVLSNDINIYNECARDYVKLLKQADLEESHRNYIDIILDQLETSIKLSTNVQKLSAIKGEKTELSTIDINRVLHNTAHNVLEKSITSSKLDNLDLKFNYPEGMYGVKADILIEELFSNIFWNSVQHNTHEKKMLEITIKEPEDKSPEHWQIDITDNAFGIPDDQKTAIFNSPSYGKEHLGRAHLGMTIIKALVERYGGRVWIENRVPDDYKQGSIFKIVLRKGELPVGDVVYGFGARC
jgi:PAS domain S-box-containing protein